MSKRDRNLYRDNILEHIAAIESYRPASRDAFLKDRRTFDAILMRLVAIGEELAAVREDVEERQPHWEWHRIIGLRNRIAHGYWEVDKDVIWELLASIFRVRDLLA
jgi:uncharacterized protein with HEPN domain